MGKKSVAQMSEREKKRHSLAAKTVGRIILSSFLLGAVALLIGLLIYGSNLVRQSIDRACKTARLAVASATNAADSIGLSKEIMGIYRGLTPEQRSLMESDAEADRETYRGFYTVLDSVTRKGGAYDVLRHMLRGYKNDVDFVYLAMYDEETSAMVYIADSDQVDPLAPGEWEKVDRDQMMRFLNWDGEGDLYAIGNTEKYGWLCTAGCPIRDREVYLPMMKEALG